MYAPCAVRNHNVHVHCTLKKGRKKQTNTDNLHTPQRLRYMYMYVTVLLSPSSQIWPPSTSTWLQRLSLLPSMQPLSSPTLPLSQPLLEASPSPSQASVIRTWWRSSWALPLLVSLHTVWCWYMYMYICTVGVNKKLMHCTEQYRTVTVPKPYLFNCTCTGCKRTAANFSKP